MRVLCAPDKFAGAATSAEVAAAMAAGVADANAVAIRMPVADGGEGSADVLQPLGGECFRLPVSGPHGAPASGRVVMLDPHTAFIESADACGIRHVSATRPLRASTFGVGELLLAALDRAPQVIVGLGGSATVDMGMGMAAALGVRLFDEAGACLGPSEHTPAALSRLAHIEVPDALANRIRGRVTAWADTGAPFLVERTARNDDRLDARSFLAQKGVVDPLPIEGYWKRCLQLLDRAGYRAETTHPGSGAAGGLGLMLHTLAGAPIHRGASGILDALGFDAAMEGADLVLTGEGRFDATSLSGKAPGEVRRRCLAAARPVTVLAGAVADGYESKYVVAISDATQPLPAQLRQTLKRVRTEARRTVERHRGGTG